MPHIDIEARAARAVEYFMQGYGCCQAVSAAFADVYGVPERLMLRMAAGFGGGVGRQRMLCGTVSAMTLLAGLERGQTEGADREGKAACYKLVQELCAEFKARNGSVVCAELLGLKGSAPITYVPDRRDEHYYKVRPCAAKVASAARIYAEMLGREGGQGQTRLPL